MLFAGSQVSLVVLPLMLFHPNPVLVYATLARRYAGRPHPGGVAAERKELSAAPQASGFVDGRGALGTLFDAQLLGGAWREELVGDSAVVDTYHLR